MQDGRNAFESQWTDQRSSHILSSSLIDDTWQGGRFGFMKGDSDLSVTQKYDNLKIYVDADGDDNYNDEAVSQDFNSATITLTHDDNGNLTFDGLYRYTYDVLNRLVKVCYGTETAAGEVPVSLYEYDGMNRRISKTVTNSGAGIVRGSDDGGTIAGIQAGNLVEHYYYAGWRVIEERDGAEDGGHVLAQMVWSTEYIDAPICRDRNTDPDSDGAGYNAAAADCLESPGSQRYFYHQDLNYRVLALTDESGDVVERYDYAAYGEPRITAGYNSAVSGESGYMMSASLVGNPYMHQGLRRDAETGLHENRMRTYNSRLGRFMQRDPWQYYDTMNLYAYLINNPCSFIDAFGLCSQAQLDDIYAQIDNINDAIDAIRNANNNLTSDLQDALSDYYDVKHNYDKLLPSLSSVARGLAQSALAVGGVSVYFFGVEAGAGIGGVWTASFGIVAGGGIGMIATAVAMVIYDVEWAEAFNEAEKAVGLANIAISLANMQNSLAYLIINLRNQIANTTNQLWDLQTAKNDLKNLGYQCREEMRHGNYDWSDAIAKKYKSILTPARKSTLHEYCP